MELLAYVTFSLKSLEKTQPPFDQVKSNIDRLISNCDSFAERNNIPKEDYDLGRFAIFAWIDEVILNSQWSEREQWQKNLLQRIHFQTMDAGEIFFERMNNIGAHQRDVREVYYLCLAMGFTGRYIHEGDDFLLEQLKSSNLKLLTGSSVGLPSLDKGELFSEAYPQTSHSVTPKTTKWKVSSITLVSIGFPVVLFFVLFLVYNFILNNITENLLSTVP